MESRNAVYDQTRRSYDSLAQRYASVWSDDKVYQELLSTFLGSLPPVARILDVGAGPGQYSRQFARAGHIVTGVDFSEAMMRCALDTRVSTERSVVADMRALPFVDRAFDAIWACASTIHILKTDMPSVLEGFTRILAPHGWVLVNAVISNLGLRVEREHEMSSEHIAGRTFQHYASSEESVGILELGGFVVKKIHLRTVTSTVVERSEHPTNSWINYLCQMS